MLPPRRGSGSMVLGGRLENVPKDRSPGVLRRPVDDAPADEPGRSQPGRCLPPSRFEGQVPRRICRAFGRGPRPGGVSVREREPGPAGSRWPSIAGSRAPRGGLHPNNFYFAAPESVDRADHHPRTATSPMVPMVAERYRAGTSSPLSPLSPLLLLVGATRAYLFSPGAASLEHGVEHGEGHGDLVAPVQLNEAGYYSQTEIRVLERVGENVAGIADRSGLPDAS